MTSRKNILPYYYPTTLVCIDDDHIFLSNFALQLDDHYSYKLFSSPSNAVEFINNSFTDSPLEKRCLSYYRPLNENEDLLHFDFNVLEREISDGDRYKEVSVIIVDYEMHDMDGLELCNSIRDPNIKKVLLTGVADSNIAIDAFNKGIIDRFIVKNDPHIIETIHTAVRELQHQYFSDISRVIQHTLEVTTKGLLSNTKFNQFFLQLLNDKSIAEYYFVENLTGFLLISTDGSIFRLIIQNKEQLAAGKTLAEKFRAPADFISKVSWGDYIVNFWESPDDYYDKSEFDWSENLLPALPIPGVEGYKYALIDNPPVEIDYITQSTP